MLSALFTDVVLLGGVFIFIILFKLLHKQRHNKKLAKQKVFFADIARKRKLEISEHETINNYLLAIDKLNSILLYINFNHSKEQVVVLDLWQIRTLQVATEDNSVYEQKKGVSILVDKQVSKLQLEITLVDVQPKMSLVLYEYEDGMHNFAHIKNRAAYWCQLVNNGVQELPHPSRQTSEYA